MAMKIIEIIVTPQGETTLQTKGFTGGSCREVSELIGQALGKSTNDKLIQEFYGGLHEQQQPRIR
ncbi:MAG: DUF2997 domain-containing protein [Phycisphaerae bacterium]